MNISEGWKLVPVDPTREMLVAALKTHGVCPIYAAMLAAAPVPPQADAQPVAVLYKDGTVLTRDECGTSFDICCKVETPLYTHADAGEVERLRADIDTLNSLCLEYKATAIEACEAQIASREEIATLRAQLAELRHAVWHALDDSGDNEVGDIVIMKADFETLCTLVPEEWHDEHHSKSASAEPAKKMCDCNQGRLPCTCKGGDQ